LPLLARGSLEDVLNPSVIRTKPDEYLNYYSAFDGKTWRTHLATSTEGRKWKPAGLILQPDPKTWEGSYIAANGHAALVGAQYLYWYQAGPMGRTRIGLARSQDGQIWHKHPEPVLPLGPRGAWDEISLGDPYVIESGGMLYLFYLGEDRARRQRLGVARSKDGTHWEKVRANPVLELGKAGEFDENGLGEPAVWIHPGPGPYWMLYTGRARNEVRRMGLAWSADGVRWTKLAEPRIEGKSAWNSQVVCDATVLPDGRRVRVWFGGGDVAHPAERIHGQIGYGELTLTEAAATTKPGQTSPPNSR
jgi:predicted GH43/DUF377 family glycosyl hydrolase